MKNTGLIDLYKINDLNSGLGQFTFHLAKQLMLSHSDLRLDFLLPSPDAAKLFQPTANHKNIFANFQKRYLPGLNADYTFWHSTHQFPSFMPNRSSLLILTIHDLNFLGSRTPNKEKKYLRKLQENIDRSDIITTISHYTKGEIEKHLNLKNKSIKVIYNGIPDPDFRPNNRPAWVGDAPFFFSVGVFKKTKNFKALLPLMKHFAGYKLIMAGNKNTEYGREIAELIARFGIKDQVVLPGIISENEKQWLYENCSAFLFPSVAEGFGMPLAEAMKTGCPVFSSKLTSLPEIGGNAVYYFDSFDEHEMKNTLLSGLDDFSKNVNERKDAMTEQARKFDWGYCAASYANLYREILGNK